MSRLEASGLAEFAFALVRLLSIQQRTLSVKRGSPAGMSLMDGRVTYSWVFVQVTTNREVNLLANQKQRDLLLSGKTRWDNWRRAYPDVQSLEPDLHGADLHGADLRGVDLHGADLTEANLQGADLREADLRNANLLQARLHWTDLRGATLNHANIKGADLSKTDLRGADLEEQSSEKRYSLERTCPGEIFVEQISVNARKQKKVDRGVPGLVNVCTLRDELSPRKA